MHSQISFDKVSLSTEKQPYPWLVHIARDILANGHIQVACRLAQAGIPVETCIDALRLSKSKAFYALP